MIPFILVFLVRPFKLADPPEIMKRPNLVGRLWGKKRAIEAGFVLSLRFSFCDKGMCNRRRKCMLEGKTKQ